MSSVLTSIYGSFERLLRYVYPGFLFLLLFALSKPCLFNSVWVAINKEFVILLIIGFVISIPLQMFGAYFITEIINMVFVWVFHWNVDERHGITPDPFSAGEVTHEDLKPRWSRLHWLAKNYFDLQARSIEFRSSRNKQDIYSYNKDSWGRYHAIISTVWLLILFVFCNDSHSIMSHYRWGILVFAVLLLIAGIIIFMRLSRVREKAIKADYYESLKRNFPFIY